MTDQINNRGKEPKQFIISRLPLAKLNIRNIAIKPVKFVENSNESGPDKTVVVPSCPATQQHTRVQQELESAPS